MAGKHRAGSGKVKDIDPDKPFKHKDLKGETAPSRIKAALDAATAKAKKAADLAKYGK
jgi:hypothetical protein